MIILAGGFGTRLRGTVSDVPKPMAPAGGRPFLAHLLGHLMQFGFDDFIFSLHHEAEIIRGYFSQAPEFRSVRRKFVVEDLPLGTGGAVAWTSAAVDLQTPFYVVNGDTMLSGDIRLLAEHRSPGEIQIALAEVPDASRYGRVEVAPGGGIRRFSEKAAGSGPGLINAGSYFLERGVFAELGKDPGDVFSMEGEVFPQFVEKRRIFGTPIPGSFIDIGVPEDYFQFKHQVEK